MTSRAARFLAATFCLSCSTAALAQNPAAVRPAETVIRSSAHEVVLDIVATDANGAPIPNLTERDFVVKENGRRQQPDAFGAHFVVPGARTVAAPALPPGIFSNAIQMGIPEAPVSVILLDLRDMGPANQTISQTQLLPLLRHLPAGQRVALFTLTDPLHLIRGVTSDAEELVSALTDGTNKASRNYLNPLPQSGGGTIYREQIEATIDGVLQMREFLAAIPGRKNLIWLASRFPSRFTDVGLLTDALAAEKLQQHATELNFTQTAIYPIDVTGVHRLREGRLSAAEELADGTGGKFFYSNNDAGALVAEAMKNGTNYYRLSYSPTNHDYNGAYRTVSVTHNRPGAHLQYRHGYSAIDKEKQLTPTELALMFGTPPQSGITFTARVIPQPDNSGSKSGSALQPGISASRTYEIACIAHPEQIATALGSDGVRHSDTTLVAVAYDSAGNVLNGVQGQYAWTMTPPQWTGIQRDGYVMVQQIALPMKTAALRIGLVDKTDSHTGSIQIPASALPTQP